MSSIQFWLNPPATCPKCGKDTVRLSYIEVDEDGETILNYACPTCRMVKAAVIDRRPKGSGERE